MIGFTRNDVLELEEQNALIQIGASDTSNCFAVGDLVNESWERAIKNGWDKPTAEKGGDHVTKGFICASVSYYLSNKSARTVRYYADVSAFFPVPTRDAFDMLSFSHFANARKHEDWPDYLVYAQSGGPDGGIVSVEGCEAEWKRRHQENVQGWEALSTDDEKPASAETENKFSFASVCRYALNLVDRFQSDPDVPDGPRKKLSRAIRLINEAIEEDQKFMVK
jgi:hypothetical protein